MCVCLFGVVLTCIDDVDTSSRDPAAVALALKTHRIQDFHTTQISSLRWLSLCDSFIDVCVCELARVWRVGCSEM